MAKPGETVSKEASPIVVSEQIASDLHMNHQFIQEIESVDSEVTVMTTRQPFVDCNNAGNIKEKPYVESPKISSANNINLPLSADHHNNTISRTSSSNEIMNNSQDIHTKLQKEDSFKNDTSSTNLQQKMVGNVSVVSQQTKTTVVPVLMVPKVPLSEVHKSGLSSSVPNYQCSECDYSSHNKHYLKQHIDLVHVSNRPFQCPFCDYAGKRSQSLKEHLVVHSSECPYSCHICSASFRKKGHLTSHIRLHGNVRTFECNICRTDFSKRELLYMHLRETHRTQNVFACDQCEYATTIKSNIIMHMHTHSNPKTYKCSMCDFKALHINLLNQHMKQHGQSQDGTSNQHVRVIMLKCTECGYTTDSEDVLRDHMWTHIDIKDQHGTSTSTVTEADSSLRLSVPSVNQETASAKKHDVTVANITQKSDNHLKERPQGSLLQQQTVRNLPVIDKSSGNVIYKCTECSFTSVEAYTFITHMLSHKPRYPKPSSNMPVNPGSASFVFDSEHHVFRCLICGYACEHQRTIKSHIWKHSGHKEIVYPMFQNGPLSLYDSEEDEIAAQHVQSPDIEIGMKESESVGLVDLLKKRPAVHGEIFPVVKTIIIPSSTADTSHLTVPTLPALPGRILKTHSASSLASVGSDNGSKRSLEDHELLAKHFCSSDGKNVIVETLNDIYCTPKFSVSYSNQSSPKTVDSIPAGEITVETSPAVVVNSTESTGVVTAEMTNADNSTRTIVTGSNFAEGEDMELSSKIEVLKTVAEISQRDVSQQNMSEAVASNSPSHDEDDAITLLSLLKKGPNFNPACPTTIPGATKLELPKKRKHDHGKANEIDIKHSASGFNSAKSVKSETGSVASDASKSKSGICSSLLAVIEQLRERSTSESENDDNVSVSTRTSSRKRNKKSTISNDKWIEEYPNVELTKSPDGKYRCKLCHYYNNNEGLMKQHMVVHKSKKPFECSLCDFIGTSSEDLQDHMISHCKVRTYQCRTCQLSFTYKSQLRAHVRTSHAPVQPPPPDNAGVTTNSFICDECDFTASNCSTLKVHMEDHKLGMRNSDSSSHVDNGSDKMLKSQSKTVRCEYCDYTCANINRMKQHQNVHQDGPIKCHLCEFTAISNRSLKSHMKRHINDQRYVKLPLEQYKCGLCGYVCHHLPSLKSHMWRHASDNKYQYEVTNTAINAAIDYETKISVSQKSSDGEPLDMENDNKGSTEESGGVVCFRCCKCGFESRDKRVLQEHMKSHVEFIKRPSPETSQNAANNLPITEHQKVDHVADYSNKQ